MERYYYGPMAKGFLYLAAVLNWALSYTLDVDFCSQTLADALRIAPAPHIFSPDQSSQFMSLAFEQTLV